MSASRVWARLLAVLLLADAAPSVALERPESAHPAQNFVLYCGGCHGANGTGVPHKVPVLAGGIGRFLGIEGGREFLLRVPGVANSQLSDAGLAAVMNYCIERFAAAERPQGFVPYTAAEVGQARREPLLAVQRARAALLARSGGTVTEY